MQGELPLPNIKKSPQAYVGGLCGFGVMVAEGHKVESAEFIEVEILHLKLQFQGLGRMLTGWLAGWNMKSWRTVLEQEMPNLPGFNGGKSRWLERLEFQRGRSPA